MDNAHPRSTGDTDRGARAKRGTGSNAADTRRVRVARAIRQGNGAEAAEYRSAEFF